MVLSRLQAHRHQVGDSLRQQRLIADRELSSRKRRQRLFQFERLLKVAESTTPVSKSANVIAGPSFAGPGIPVKILFVRGQGARPVWQTKKMARRVGKAPQLSTKVCKLGDEVRCGENRRGSTRVVGTGWRTPRHFPAPHCARFQNSTSTSAVASRICGWPQEPPNWPTICEERLTQRTPISAANSAAKTRGAERYEFLRKRDDKNGTDSIVACGPVRFQAANKSGESISR